MASITFAISPNYFLPPLSFWFHVQSALVFQNLDLDWAWESQMSAKPEVPRNRSHSCWTTWAFSWHCFPELWWSLCEHHKPSVKKANNPLITSKYILKNFIHMAEPLYHKLGGCRIEMLWRFLFGNTLSKVCLKGGSLPAAVNKTYLRPAGLSHPGFTFSHSYQGEEDCSNFSKGIFGRKIGTQRGMLRLELYCCPRIALRAQVYCLVRDWYMEGMPNRWITLQSDNCTNLPRLTQILSWCNSFKVTFPCWGILEQCIALELCDDAASLASWGTQSNCAAGVNK